MTTHNDDDRIIRGKDAAMTATDPLREALERIASPPDFWRIGKASQIAREALAAVPAEPEAWEWRAVERHSGEQYGSPMSDRAARLYIARGDLAHGLALERRRAPGPWERVDPKPQPQDRGEQ